MQALAFWKTVLNDEANLLGGLIALLEENEIRFCVIGDQAVNAFAEPVVSLDLDLVVAAGQLDEAEAHLDRAYEVERFAHSLNVSVPGSDLRVQIQTDRRYLDFPERALGMNLLGLNLPVASLEDILQGKVWAVQDPTRQASKRQKDLADISRILESYPALRDQVPEEVLSQMF